MCRRLKIVLYKIPLFYEKNNNNNKKSKIDVYIYALYAYSLQMEYFKHYSPLKIKINRIKLQSFNRIYEYICVCNLFILFSNIPIPLFTKQKKYVYVYNFKNQNVQNIFYSRSWL